MKKANAKLSKTHLLIIGFVLSVVGALYVNSAILSSSWRNFPKERGWGYQLPVGWVSATVEEGAEPEACADPEQTQLPSDQMIKTSIEGLPFSTTRLYAESCGYIDQTNAFAHKLNFLVCLVLVAAPVYGAINIISRPKRSKPKKR